MTNSSVLKEIISNSGISYAFLARKMNLSRTGFYKKVNGELEFKQTEIELLCNLLHISSLKERQNIFFCQKVDK